MQHNALHNALLQMSMASAFLLPPRVQQALRGDPIPAPARVESAYATIDGFSNALCHALFASERASERYRDLIVRKLGA